MVAAVDSATIIEIGDLVWQDKDDAMPAGDSDTVGCFTDNFLGVAMQRSQAGYTQPIRVATTGVFEYDCYDCYLSNCELGDLVGVEFVEEGGEDGKTRLASQAVRIVDNADIAIARVARRHDAATRTLLVDIRSTVMTGGIIQR